jgi:hypothetical protein
MAGSCLGLLGIMSAVNGFGSVLSLAPSFVAEPAQRDVRPATDGPPIANTSNSTIVQRWTLLGGELSQLTVSSAREVPGSSGVSIECAASPSQHLVFEGIVRPSTGAWILRIDDGTSAPRWIPLANELAVRVTGSSHYRFLVYSDDVRASASIQGITIRHASEADRRCIDLAWPQSGPLVEAEASNVLSQWRAIFGIRDSDGDEASAARVAAWVHGRSRVVGADAPWTLVLADRCVWQSEPPPTIDGSCGNFSSALVEALRRVGIVARRVHLGSRRFERGEERFDTHVLVEAFDRKNERWVLVDPTFNVQFVDGGGRSLGIAELMALHADGGKWALRQIAPPLPGRSAAEYYLPLSDLLWAADAPAVSTLGALGAQYQSLDQTVDEIARTRYAPRSSP